MSEEDPKRPRGRPRKTDPAHVAEIAMTEYWRDDPADVSVNRVCRAAGVSKPSLYRDFGSEDGLMVAALERYAERVLSDVFGILEAGRGLKATLAALVDFACEDPRMESGCLFYKMRAGKHRLGPLTRARVEALDADARAAYRAFLEARREAGEGAAGPSPEAGARYLAEQIALAFAQRAAGEDPRTIRDTLTLALSVFGMSPKLR